MVFPAHLLIANKVVNIWECFETTTTGVTRNHTNEKEPPSTIHKLPTIRIQIEFYLSNVVYKILKLRFALQIILT